MEEWHPEWEKRCGAIIKRGLPARVRGVELMPPWDGHQLLAIVLDVDENLLPRSHQQRGFELHISLLFTNELIREKLLLESLLLNARWKGRDVVLDVDWIGSGGAAFLAASDPIASDPYVRRLHSAGYYAGRDLHVSL